MSLIDIQNLTFGYDGSFDTIFENVSLRLDTDWKLGFTGRNGRGKTTFLHLLMGKWPFQGRITASVQFDYFPFPVADKNRPVLEVLRDIVPESVRDENRWRLEREFSLLGLMESVFTQRFAALSNGEQTKVLLGALFTRDNHFLLIDEPTNHLDAAARQLVGDYLKGKSGFILVSHDRTFLDNCVDHILSINRANIELQRGNFSSWWHNRQRQDEYEMAQNQRLKKDIGRLSAAARRTAAWSDAVERTKIGQHVADRGAVGHKAAKMMKRSKSTEARRQRAVEEKEKLLQNIEVAEALSIHPLPYPGGRLADARDLTISYDGRPVCENIHFTLRQGERMAILGPNGSGKTSLLKLMLGEDIPHTGQLTLGSGVKISYVSQDTSFLKGSFQSFAAAHNIEESLFKAILRKLDFARVQFEKDLADLSEGQKKKVLLAQSLCENAHLYIWDEPLNFIDLMSRMQIETLLAQSDATMLFVEHDAAFVDAVATTRLYL